MALTTLELQEKIKELETRLQFKDDLINRWSNEVLACREETAKRDSLILNFKTKVVEIINHPDMKPFIVKEVIKQICEL